MPGARGDYSKLAKIIAAAGGAATGELARQSLRTMGDEAFALARRGAAAGTNPQGRRWKATKSGGRALAHIASTLGLTVNATRFEIKSSQRVAIFHQVGAKRPPGARGGKGWRLPIRRILPKKSMPKPWNQAIADSLRALWARSFAT